MKSSLFSCALHLCGGNGTLGRAWRQFTGLNHLKLYEVDVKPFADHDLSDIKIQKLVRGWIRAKKIRVLWISMPHDLIYNPRVAGFFLSAVQLCIDLGVPVAVDGLQCNPAWKLASFGELVRLPTIDVGLADSNAYRMGRRLRFQIASSRIGLADSLHYGYHTSSPTICLPWTLPFEACRNFCRCIRSTLVKEVGASLAKFFVPEA